MWTYDGWADLSFMGGEVKDPGRTLPLALILGTTGIVLVYLLLNFAYIYLVPLPEMAASPLIAATAAERIPLFAGAGGAVVSGGRDGLLLRRAHRLDDDGPADLLRHGRPRPLLPRPSPGSPPIPEPVGGDLAGHRARRRSTSCSTTSSSWPTSSSWASGRSTRSPWRRCSCSAAPGPTCRGPTAPGDIRWCRCCSCWRRWGWC